MPALLFACGNTALPTPAPSNVTASAKPHGTPPVCHPAVSGCGCAYACATGVAMAADRTWTIQHDRQYRSPTTAIIEAWCFDPRGVGKRADPASAAKDARTTCVDVFDEQSMCGGECIPSTAFLGCHAEGDRCVP